MVASLCAAPSTSLGPAPAWAWGQGAAFQGADAQGATLERVADRSKRDKADRDRGGKRDKAGKSDRSRGGKADKAAKSDKSAKADRSRGGKSRDRAAARAERAARATATGTSAAESPTAASAVDATDTGTTSTGTTSTGTTTADDTPTAVDGPTPTPRDTGATDDTGSGTGGGDTGADADQDDTPTTVDGPSRPDDGDTDTGSTDTGTGSTDTDTGSTDTDTGSTDTGTGSTDTGTGSTDTGTGSTDTDTGSTDTGTGSTDTGTGSTDTGTGSTDTDTGSGSTGSGTGSTGSGGSGTGSGTGTDSSTGSGTGTTGTGGSSGSGTTGGGTATAGGGGTTGGSDPTTDSGGGIGGAVADGGTPRPEGDAAGPGTAAVALGSDGDSGTTVSGTSSTTSATTSTTDGATTTKPSLVEIVKSIFSGNSTTATAKTTTTTTTTATSAAATATTAAVAAAVATTPVVTAPVVAAPVAAAVAKVKAAAVELEPKAAATAPRIRLSSGGGSETYRRYEITALGLTAQSRQVLGALGFKTLSEHRSPLLGNRIVARLRTPGQQTAEAALERARNALPDLTFDYAHLYRPSGEQAPVRYAANMIGAPTGATCPVNARVGLIDSGVAKHPTLAGARIVRKNFVEKGAATNVAHGTAIASILVGDLPGTGPLMPSTQLFSANVFAQDGAGGVRADATAIIAALDWMAAQRVPVVNLSLMGQSNALLEQAIKAAATRGLVMVAAAGNEGPSAEPAYPAAYPGVIAVAAVDARGRPYGNNNRGSYIYVAAPGVDIWGADARGGLAFWTGTSFAAPFVTATLARDIALGRARNVNDGRALIASSARDLGAPGRDPIYGYGLLQSGGCGGAAAPTLSARN